MKSIIASTMLMITLAFGIIGVHFLGAHLCGGVLENHEGCSISTLAEDAKLVQMMVYYDLNGLDE